MKLQTRVGKSDWQWSESDFFHEVRQRSKESLYYLAGTVLHMQDLTEDLHLPYANYIQLLPWNGGPPNSLRKLAWMPRGHFKSSVASIAFPLWLLIHDRNTSIGLISSKEKQVQEWLRSIADHIRYNTFFQWAFPEIQIGAKCDEHELLIQRDADIVGQAGQASVTAYTIKGGMASQHCKHLILDDPLHENNAFSETEREKAIMLYTHLESVIKDYATSTFTFVGTPWPGYDVIAHAMEHEVAQGERLFWGVGAEGGFDMSESLKAKYPSLVPNLEARLKRDGVIFHEVCPKKKLEKIKRQDPQQYWYQYLCKRPTEGDNGFDTEAIHDFSMTLEGRVLCECHPGHDHHVKHMVVVGICDPALTEDKRGCESAIVTVMRDPLCGCRFLLDEWGDHVQSPDLMDRMRFTMHRHQAIMRRFAIEDVQFQTVFKSWLEESQSVGQVPLGIELFGVKPKKRDKDLRIAGQQQFVAAGMWHKSSKIKLDDKRGFLWQLEKWPNQPKVRDRIDAWSYADDAWEGLVANTRGEQDNSSGIRSMNKARASREQRLIKEARSGT